MKILGTAIDEDRNIVLNPRIFNDAIHLTSLLNEEVRTSLQLPDIQTLLLDSRDKMLHTLTLEHYVKNEIQESMPNEVLAKMSIEDFIAHYKYYLMMHEGILLKLKGELSNLSVVAAAIEELNIKFDTVKTRLQLELQEKAQIYAKKAINYIKMNTSNAPSRYDHSSCFEPISMSDWKTFYSTIVTYDNFLEGCVKKNPCSVINSEIFKILDDDFKQEGEYLVITVASMHMHPIWNDFRNDSFSSDNLPISVGGPIEAINEHLLRTAMQIAGEENFPNPIAELKERYGIRCYKLSNRITNLLFIRVIKRVQTLEDARYYSSRSIDFLTALLEPATPKTYSRNWNPTDFYLDHEEEINRLWEETHDDSSSGECSPPG